MKKKVLSLALATTLVVSALTGCGGTKNPSSASKAGSSKTSGTTSSAKSSAASTTSSAKSSAASTTSSAKSSAASGSTSTAAPGDAAGFTEIPIFEDKQVSFLNVSAVYFQPVPMAPGQEKIDKKKEIHLECDIAALENELGYGKGDWVPYLTIDYKVTDSSDKTVVAEGTFMPMSASDGPHYGANIKMDKAGTYSVEFTIHSPAEKGYLIHSDKETGPGKVLEDYFKDGNLVVKHDGWEYTPQEW